MAAAQSVIDAIDRIIEYFNARRLDLPDGVFDRRTQFVINGSPFETLLGRSPDDPYCRSAGYMNKPESDGRRDVSGCLSGIRNPKLCGFLGRGISNV